MSERVALRGKWATAIATETSMNRFSRREVPLSRISREVSDYSRIATSSGGSWSVHLLRLSTWRGEV